MPTRDDAEATIKFAILEGMARSNASASLPGQFAVCDLRDSIYRTLTNPSIAWAMKLIGEERMQEGAIVAAHVRDRAAHTAPHGSQWNGNRECGSQGVDADGRCVRCGLEPGDNNGEECPPGFLS